MVYAGYLFAREISFRQKSDIKISIGSNPLLARGAQNSWAEKSDGRVECQTPVYRFFGSPNRNLNRREKHEKYVSSGCCRELSETLLGGEVDIRDNTFNSWYWNLSGALAKQARYAAYTNRFSINFRDANPLQTVALIYIFLQLIRGAQKLLLRSYK